MKWFYTQPVDIHFESGAISKLPSILAEKQLQKGLLICDPFLVSNGVAGQIMESSQGRIAGIYSHIIPNPRLNEVDSCANQLRCMEADFAIALGGGSSMDCAKAACAIAKTDETIRPFFEGTQPLPASPLPLIAIPTTAGTGSEVTCVSVLSDPDKKVKKPISSDSLYPSLVLIDPTLTISVPPKVTASTGMDVLSHALEGYWSKNHQPICDALALHAAELVFQYLPEAYRNGQNLLAREKMCEASVIAGLAFSLPKTAASHACSFPLTSLYGIPHGEACAFTLGALCRINASAEEGRVEKFAKKLGFSNAEEMAQRIDAMKKEMGLACTLSDAGIQKEDISSLAVKCLHPNLRNNPVELSLTDLENMFVSLE